MTNDMDSADRREEVRVRKVQDVEQRERVVEDAVAQWQLTLKRVVRLIWLLGGVLETLIGTRVLLKLIAANPAAPFARFVYSITDWFLWIFRGLTASPSIEGSVLEVSSLIAMAVYALLTWVLAQMVWLVFYRGYSRYVSSYRRVG